MICDLRKRNYIAFEGEPFDTKVKEKKYEQNNYCPRI